MNGLLKKFIDFAMGNIVVLILGFASSPIISRIINRDNLGKSSMFVTLTSLFVLIISLGLDQAYIRYFNGEEEDKKGALLGKCILISTAASVLVGGIVLLFYKPISILIIGEVSFKIVLLFVVHSIFSIIGNFSIIHIRMKQRGKSYSMITIINKISYLLFIWVGYIFYKDHFMTVILATVVSNLIKLVVAIGLAPSDWKKVFGKLQTKVSNRELLRYGSPMIFSMGITWAFQSIDKLALRAFSTGYSEIGLYTMAMTIIGLLNIVQASFTTFWVPVAYEKYQNDREDKEFFVNINEIISAIMLIISVGLILFKDVIALILGPDYAGVEFVFPFLVLMPIMYTISETTVMGINFAKKSKYHIYIASMAAISNIVGNFLLVPTLGAKGAAISTGLSYVVFFVARTYFANKFFKIDFKLKKFWICLIGVYALASYSTLYKFNFVILIIGLANIALILFLYRNKAKDVMNLIKNIGSK